MVHLLIRAALAAAALCAASAAMASADVEKGHTVFHNQCSICHVVTAGGPKLLGPTLFGVVGRTAASVPGFNYSPAMKASGLTWTDETLARYLPAPAKLVPGTKMTYAGLKNPQQLADVVAYLDTLK